MVSTGCLIPVLKTRFQKEDEEILSLWAVGWQQEELKLEKVVGPNEVLALYSFFVPQA